MTDQIVITEKSSQAKDVRTAVGSRYGVVLPAEGHLLDLCEPEDANPAWKRWSTELLKPEGLYGTKPATGGNKATKLKAIRAALRTAKRVWLATDCDREGQLIGQEILEHCGYRGEVMRVMFTAQDPKTIRDAFGRARPNAEHAPLYAARDGSASEPPRDAGATPGTSSTTSPGRTSGSGSCERIGSEPSIAKIPQPHTSPTEPGRVGGVVTEPLPPQTRACAIDALGSSPARFAQEFCHERMNVTDGRGYRLRSSFIRSQFRRLRRLRRASHVRQMRMTW